MKRRNSGQEEEHMQESSGKEIRRARDEKAIGSKLWKEVEGHAVELVREVVDIPVTA